MIGPYLNGAALFSGSVVGAPLGTKLKPNLKSSMPLIFGLAKKNSWINPSL